MGPKVVIVELGSDAEMMQRLAKLPAIEIKTSQTVFKLPLEGVADALAAIEACASAASSRPLRRGMHRRQRPPRVNTAHPLDRAPARPSRPSTDAADQTAKPAPPYPDLIEERTFLTYTGERGTFRLEALIVRPAKAEGKLPIALITHGKNLKAEENQQLRADFYAPQARDFAARGWLSVVVIRRGYGESDGIPGVSRGAAYMSCQNADLVRGFDIEADDLAAALQVIAARPDADASRVIAVGQSLGGGAVLAFAARRPAGLIGVVNVSGGVWRSDGNGACDFDALVAAMTDFGAPHPGADAVALRRERQPVPAGRGRPHARGLHGSRRRREAVDVPADPERRPQPVRRLRRTREVARARSTGSSRRTACRTPTWPAWTT